MGIAPHSKWREQLLSAAELLRNTAEAPQWLATVLHEAVTYAEELEPSSAPMPQPPTFFYPH